MAYALGVRIGRLISFSLALVCVAFAACSDGDPAPTPPSETPAARPSATLPAPSPTAAEEGAPAPPLRATPTAPAPTRTAVTSPPGGATGDVSAPPASHVTSADLAARGVGTPGRGALTADRIVIATARVDAPLAAVAVPPDGAMPPPPSLDVVAWYDFSAFPALGGVFGQGGNVVLAGHAGVAGQGLGVFWRLASVAPGDFVSVHLLTGQTLCYRVEWNKIANTGEVAFDAITTATADEYLTLITGAQSPDERRIASARRANCGDAPPPAPTPSPLPGHQRLHIVAERTRITLVEGADVPVAVHTIDLSFDNLDAGVAHHLVFYDPAGAVYFDAGETVGRLIGWRQYIPAGPRTGAPQHYTFACVIHPDQMHGALTIE